MPVRQRGKQRQADVLVGSRRVRPAFATREAAERWEVAAKHAIAQGGVLPQRCRT